MSLLTKMDKFIHSDYTEAPYGWGGLPRQPGIYMYVIRPNDSEIPCTTEEMQKHLKVYLGRSKDLQERLKAHIQEKRRTFYQMDVRDMNELYTIYIKWVHEPKQKELEDTYMRQYESIYGFRARGNKMPGCGKKVADKIFNMLLRKHARQ